MDSGLLRFLLVVTACVFCHAQGSRRDVVTLCNSDLEAINRTAFDLNFGGQNRVPSSGSGQQQCMCSMMAFTMTYLDVLLKLPKPEYNFRGEGTEGLDRPITGNSKRNATCNPFVLISGEAQSDLSKCPGPILGNASKMTLTIPAGKEIKFTLHNHKEMEIEPDFRFTVLSGSLAVMCYSEAESDVWGSSSCPCDPKNTLIITDGGGVPRRRDGTSTTQTGLIAGVVSAVIFILIVAAIAAFLWWRKRGAGGHKDLEVVDPNNVASENPAFTSSRGSGMNRSAGEPEPPSSRGPIYTNVGGPDNEKIPFDPDPTLNLDLQTAPVKQGKGSTDSGVYSMPTADKGMTNNNGRYANVAPLAPDQMYNPMLNAKQASTASLTGQGALHGSMDQLDPEALYAKPNKPSKNPVNPNPAPTRSASHDQLNQRPQEGDLQQARSRSHNTSMASMGSTVETDV